MFAGRVPTLLGRFVVGVFVVGVMGFMRLGVVGVAVVLFVGRLWVGRVLWVLGVVGSTVTSRSDVLHAAATRAVSVMMAVSWARLCGRFFVGVSGACSDVGVVLWR